ncbi:hypothetical protein HDV00_010834 [Rhizophlyctis rosea]|nr:hypothetical protein HDV00_010834 [Rhizophlyctis rosea]
MGDYVQSVRRSVRITTLQVRTATANKDETDINPQKSSKADPFNSIPVQTDGPKIVKRRRTTTKVEHVDIEEEKSTSTKKPRRTTAIVESLDTEGETSTSTKKRSKPKSTQPKPDAPPKTKRPKAKAKAPCLLPTGTEVALPDDAPVNDEEEAEEDEKPIEIPDLDTTAMWERAHTTKKYVGAHVSGAKGVHNAVLNSVRIGGTAFALFVKNQRRLLSPPTPAPRIEAFKTATQKANFAPSYILPHGSYLINVANADPEKREMGYQVFLDDLKRCEDLGLELYNFHPGSAVGHTDRNAALSLVSSAINRAHKETKRIVAVIEIMAGAGTVLGATFEELRCMIDGVEDKTRVGVCLDTCHMFAAGYDIRTPEAYNASMEQFSSIVGFEYLRGMHLNDSKAALGSKKDRHENLGKGEIGWEAFRCIMNDKRMSGVPLVLETPEKEGGEGWRREIEALYALVEGKGGGTGGGG